MPGLRVNLVGGNATTLLSKDVTGYTKKDAVVIKLPANTNLKKLVREIGKFPPDSDGDNGVPPLGQIPFPPTDPAHVPTRIDIDVQAVLDTPKSFCRIVVKLLDPKFRFMPDERAITAADKAGTEMFFNLKLGTTNDGFPKARFHCFREADTPKIGFFNIGLIISDAVSGFELPIVIDPKVQNRG